MDIICSGCKARYSLKREEVDTFEYGIFICGDCGRKVKIVICPHCDASYSVTYDSVPARKYVATCRKCRNRFIVTFPPDPVARPAAETAEGGGEYRAPEPEYGREEKREEQQKEITAEKIIYEDEKKEHAPGKETIQAEKESLEDGPSGGSFFPGDFVPAAMSSFSPVKLAAAFLGVTVTLALYALLRYVIPVISPVERSSMGFSPLSALMVLFMYTVTAAVIARITIEKARNRAGVSLLAALGDSLRGTFSLLTASLVVIAVFYGGLFLFGLIPALSPLFFALLFLPLYLLFLAGFLFGMVGIWFYPSIVVDPEAGRNRGFMGLFRFVKRHGSALAWAVPFLAIASAVAGSLLSLVHYGATMFAAEVTRAMGGENAVSIFSSVPEGLRAVIDLSYPGRTVKYFGDFLFHEGAMHRMGGLVVGLPLLAVSMLFLASLISITATLSTHVYVILESGAGKREGRKARLVLFSVFALVMVYLLKRFIL